MTYNKQIQFGAYNFNIKVEMDTKAERRLNGNRWHTVTINGLGHTNFYHQKQVVDEDLEFTITQFEILAEEFVAARPDCDPYKKRMTDLGFS